MTLNNSTLKQPKALGNEKTRPQNTRNGAGDNQFGVKHDDIRVLAKKSPGVDGREGSRGGPRRMASHRRASRQEPGRAQPPRGRWARIESEMANADKPPRTDLRSAEQRRVQERRQLRSSFVCCHRFLIR
jgi:hypothetical protein